MQGAHVLLAFVKIVAVLCWVETTQLLQSVLLILQLQQAGSSALMCMENNVNCAKVCKPLTGNASA